MSNAKYYLTLEYLVEQMEQSPWVACMCILKEHGGLFRHAPGSLHNHQAWPGGYWDHLTETMNTACRLYAMLSSLRPLPFSLSDALFVLFLHDIEKPWKYEREGGTLRIKPELASKEAQHVYRAAKFAEYGITLTPEQENALRYCEGEHKDYSPERRAMGSLAAFCHMCDVASARLWPEHPLEEHDPWQGAHRIAVESDPSPY